MTEAQVTSLWQQNDSSTLNLYLTIHTKNLSSEVVDIARQIAPGIDSVENAIQTLGVNTVQGIVHNAAILAARKVA